MQLPGRPSSRHRSGLSFTAKALLGASFVAACSVTGVAIAATASEHPSQSTNTDRITDPTGSPTGSATATSITRVDAPPENSEARETSTGKPKDVDSEVTEAPETRSGSSSSIPSDTDSDTDHPRADDNPTTTRKTSPTGSPSQRSDDHPHGTPTLTASSGTN